jgi:hypothetical protein
MMNQQIKTINYWEIETSVCGLVMKGQIISWHLQLIPMMIYMVQEMLITGRRFPIKMTSLNGTLSISHIPE